MNPPPSDLTSTPSTSRILGLDVARAFAIGGMALIHFAMVLSSADSDSALGWWNDRLAGRPATAFMLLAGIGVALQAARPLDATRRRLWRRGLFFLAVGYLNLLIWDGDILRVYGVAYLAAVLFIACNKRVLCALSAASVGAFLVLGVLIDFETNWDFDTLHYANLWTPKGAALNLFYNGFRAVFPWLAVFVFGMVIGKLDLRSRSVQKKLIGFGLLCWAVAELASFAIRRSLYGTPDLDDETIDALFGTDSLPAMPLFLLSSCGLVVAGIAACVWLAQRERVAKWSRPVASAGQLAFTWYILHILLVIAGGWLTGFDGDMPMLGAWIVSALFFAVMVVLSMLYRRRFRLGPLEWVLRKVAT